MKVLLIATNSLVHPYPVYPIGIDYVAGAISPSHQVDIIDLCNPDAFQRLDTKIKEFSPDIVGLSLRNMDTTDVTKILSFTGQFSSIISRVRQTTRLPVVLGGSAFSIFPVHLMEALDADYGIVGEGERLVTLLDALEKGNDPSGVPGVITKGKKKALPPQWDGPIVRSFDRNRAYVEFYLKNGGMLNIQTKRGCPLECIYCTYPLIDGKKVRCFDPKAVGRLARELQDAGAKFIYITDSLFNINVAHSIEVAEAFATNKVSVPWGGFFTPKPMPKDYFRKMAECGLTHVEFGTDSLCDSVLSSYRKPFSVQHVLESHRMACEAGLYVAHYLLLGGPGENERTLEETLAHADSLERAVLFFFFGMRIYPETSLYSIALAEGKIENQDTFTKPIYYQADAIGPDAIMKAVKQRARGRLNWIIGSGGELMEKTVSRMHSQGYTGPLWEKLI